MLSGQANVDGIKLGFERTGRGAPLVLIHGYPLDRTIWRDVATRLEADFDMLIPDLRGFGESELLEADQSIIAYASDVAGLMDRFRIKQAAIAGHSMGGYVALAFAREYPERVSALGLVSSQLAADTPERKEGRYATARQVLADGVGKVADSMSPMLSGDLRIQAFVHDLISRQRPQALASALKAMADRLDSSELFRSFTFPVVIVHGEADALIPVARAREMRAALPPAHYVELAGLGHMPMMEDAASVAEALRFFLHAKSKGVKLLDG